MEPKWFNKSTLLAPRTTIASRLYAKWPHCRAETAVGSLGCKDTCCVCRDDIAGAHPQRVVDFIKMSGVISAAIILVLALDTTHVPSVDTTDVLSETTQKPPIGPHMLPNEMSTASPGR